MAHSPIAFTREHTLRDLREGLALVQEETAAALAEYGFDEAVVNGFRHGNRSDPAKVVVFRTHIDASGAVFEVLDEGPGFDPAAIPNPTEDENLEIPSGRGVMLIKAYMTQVEYVPPGNKLRMVYRKPA